MGDWTSKPELRETLALAQTNGDIHQPPPYGLVTHNGHVSHYGCAHVAESRDAEVSPP